MMKNVFSASCIRMISIHKKSVTEFNFSKFYVLSLCGKNIVRWIYFYEQLKAYKIRLNDICVMFFNSVFGLVRTRKQNG